MAVLLPLLGAALTLAVRRSPGLQRAISVGVLSAVAAVAGTLVHQTDANGPQVLWLGAWPEPLGIAFVADRLSSLMLLVSAVVALLVLVFAIGQGQADDEEDTPMSIFHPTYLVLMAGVSNAFLAGDLFNLFVGFEILLFASLRPAHPGGVGGASTPGTTYVVVSLVSLVALPRRPSPPPYAATGTVNLARARRCGSRGCRPPSPWWCSSAAAHPAFGIKAAVFPMSLLAARQLPHGARARHRRLRRPPHQGRRLRDPSAPRRCSSRGRRSTGLLMWAALSSPCSWAFSAPSPSPASRGSSRSPW